MNMGICGTCVHYRYEEDYSTIHIITGEYCALDQDIPCCYEIRACKKYTPDGDYIEFMGFNK